MDILDSGNDHGQSELSPDSLDDSSKSASVQDVYEQAIYHLRLAEMSLAGSQTYPRNVQLLLQASHFFEAAIDGFKLLATSIEGSEQIRLQLQILELTVQQLHTLADFYYYTGDMPHNVEYHEKAALAMEKCLAFAIDNDLLEEDSTQAIYWRGRVSALWGDALEGKARIAEEAERWAEAAEYHAQELDHKRKEIECYARVTEDEGALGGSKGRMLSADQARLVCLARDCMARGDGNTGLSYLQQASVVAEEAYRVSPDWFPYRTIADQLRAELRDLLIASALNRVELKYVDLEINIGVCRGESIYPIEVKSSIAGEAQGDFRLPISPMDLGHFLGFLSGAIGRYKGVLRRSSSERTELESFGKRLWGSVLENPKVRSIYERTASIALSDDISGLRFRLVLDDEVLCCVPWEFLHDGEQFLVVSQRTPVVRHIRLSKPLKPMQIAPPLRMLVAVASPKNLPPLDIKAEWQRVCKALESASLLVETELLEHTSYASLQRTLGAARVRGEGFHIIHYIGHGDYDRSKRVGYLSLEAEDSQEAELTRGDAIGNLLRDHPSVRLVVLNSCQGSRGGAEQSFTSVAESLVRVGVPAVVAMQFPISDRAAITFSDYFYSALALGYPVDAAVAEARKAIYAIPESVEFGTPILYMRSKEGILFDLTDWIGSK